MKRDDLTEKLLDIKRDNGWRWKHIYQTTGGTSMAWEADVKIAGPVGAMGQRVLQPIVNQQVTQVLEALEKRVAEASGSGE